MKIDKYALFVFEQAQQSLRFAFKPMFSTDPSFGRRTALQRIDCILRRKVFQTPQWTAVLNKDPMTCGLCWMHRPTKKQEGATFHRSCNHSYGLCLQATVQICGATICCRTSPWLPQKAPEVQIIKRNWRNSTKQLPSVTAEWSVHGFAGTEEEQCGGDSHPQDADNEQR